MLASFKAGRKAKKKHPDRTVLYLSVAKERLQRHLSQCRVSSSQTHPCERMDDRAADLDASFARLKLSLAGNDSDFEDALAEFAETANLARHPIRSFTERITAYLCNPWRPIKCSAPSLLPFAPAKLWHERWEMRRGRHHAWEVGPPGPHSSLK